MLRYSETPVRGMGYDRVPVRDSRLVLYPVIHRRLSVALVAAGGRSTIGRHGPRPEPVAAADGKIGGGFTRESEDVMHPATVPDHPPPFTFEEWLDLPEQDGNRYELLDGALIVSPGPMVPHQRIFSRLLIELSAAAPEGLEVLPLNLRLNEDTAFVPDLAVAQAQAVDEGGLYLGAGDIVLAAEIVSHSSRRMDRFTKPAAYAEAGVPHYWRIEQDQGPRLFAYELSGEAYRLVAECPPGRPARVERPFPLSFDPARWAGPRRGDPAHP